MIRTLKEDSFYIECVVVKKNGDSYDLTPTNPQLANRQIHGIIAGKIHRLRLIPGDVVRVEMPPREAKTRAGKLIGRIIDRIKTEEEIQAALNAKRKR